MTQREFEEMAGRCERLMYTAANRLLCDEYLAQDAVQEALLAAWVHRASCPDTEEGRRAWLCRIAVNKAKDERKSAWRRRVTACEDPEAGAPERCVQSAEECAERRMAAQAAVREVHALAQPYRTVCALCFFGGLGPQEIAGRLHRPQRTVCTQLYRARRTLRSALDGAC